MKCSAPGCNLDLVFGEWRENEDGSRTSCAQCSCGRIQVLVQKAVALEYINIDVVLSPEIKVT